MAKDEKENGKEKKEVKKRSGLVKDLNAGGEQRVNFNFFLADIVEYMGDYYQSRFGKRINKDTLMATEVRDMVFDNKLWHIPKSTRSSGNSAKMEAVKEELSEEEMAELRRKMRAAQQAEIDKVIKARNIKVE